MEKDAWFFETKEAMFCIREQAVMRHVKTKAAGAEDILQVKFEYIYPPVSLQGITIASEATPIVPKILSLLRSPFSHSCVEYAGIY